MYIRISMFVDSKLCLLVSMYVCMYVCMYLHVYVYICVSNALSTSDNQAHLYKL
jgi:hypothetical protein